MSSSLKTLYRELLDLNSDIYPDFVVNNEIKRRGIGVGDYVPKLDHSWGGEDHYRFDFKNSVLWDFQKSDELYSVVERDPKYHVLRPKSRDYFVGRLLRKHRSMVTWDMLLNHHFIFDKRGYEHGGTVLIAELLAKKDYQPYSYYDPISGEGIESKDDVEGMVCDRVCAMIGSDYIVTSLDFLETSPDLLEKIGRKFFDAKT